MLTQLWSARQPLLVLQLGASFSGATGIAVSLITWEEMIDRPLHDTALADVRRIGGGTSFVDRVTLAFAARHGISRAFAYDADLAVAGLGAVGMGG